MTDGNDLNRRMNDRLSQLRARERVRRSLLLCGRFALVGGAVAVVAAIVAAIASAEWSPALMRWSAALIPVFAMIGLCVGYLRRVDDLHVARALDRAAGSDDRFASAMQLADHKRADRAALVLEDALQRVGATPAQAALPLRTPRELRWLPLPVVALALLIVFVPAPVKQVQASTEPEVSADEWKSLHDEMNDRIANLPEPQTPEERELADQLRRLSDLLKENPEKKDALAELAKLRDELEKKQQQLGTRDLSLKNVAQALSSSAMLGTFAQLLAAGDYEAAAAELEKLAQELEDNKLGMDAEDFENAAKDLEQLASELEKHKEMGQECRSAASAAGRMNRQELSQALRRLSKSMNRNCKSMRQCDSLCRSRSILDDILRRLGQCKGGKCEGDGEGDGARFVKRNDKKGGKKAGWGTASQWAGGKLDGQKGETAPSMEDPAEGPGEVSVLPTVSPDERAASAQEFKEMYAQMVRKAEADLELETVPPAMREYLKRYFVSIRPSEPAAGETPAAPEK